MIKIKVKKPKIKKLVSKYAIQPLTITNDKGDKIEIPEKYRVEVQDMIKSGCNNCIDNFLKSLKK